MRETLVATAGRRNIAPVLIVVVLVSWLVVQNVALLLMWSWPAVPAMLSVARALLKVAAILAVQLAPALLVAGGVAMLWVAAGRNPPPTPPRLEEVRHG